MPENREMPPVPDWNDWIEELKELRKELGKLDADAETRNTKLKKHFEAEFKRITDSTEYERLADEYATEEDMLDIALEGYEAAWAQINAWLNASIPMRTREFFELQEAQDRIEGKARVIRTKLGINDNEVEKLQQDAELALAEGDLARASLLQLLIGEELEHMSNHDETEIAYRESVAFARQLDLTHRLSGINGDKEAVFSAFRRLINFLSPSEEALSLTNEMAMLIVGPEGNCHPMRAAEIAGTAATAYLAVASQDHNRLDEAIQKAEVAVKMYDDCCFHDQADEIADLATGTLWRYQDPRAKEWDNRSLPKGHVHLWDIKVDMDELMKKVGGAQS